MGRRYWIKCRQSVLSTSRLGAPGRWRRRRRSARGLHRLTRTLGTAGRPADWPDCVFDALLQQLAGRLAHGCGWLPTEETSCSVTPWSHRLMPCRSVMFFLSLRKKTHFQRFFSMRCNIYISRLCYDVSVRLSVRLSVTEVHWRIIANLGFTFRSQFTAHCGRGACGREGRDHRREEWRDHLALC